MADMPKTFAHQGEAAAGGSAHRANAGMGGTDRHIHHANLVFHLPDHDAGLARVRRHPVQNAGRRAHGVGAVEFHSRCRASHGHRDVAAEHRVAVLRHGKWPGERLEIRGGIVIAGPRNSDVFGHHGFAFLLELLGENLLQRLESNAHHAETSANRERVLRHLIPGDVGQLRNRKRAELHALRGGARLDRVSVVDTCSAGGKQSEVAIHGVLVQRDQQIDAVTHVGDSFRAGANGEKSVAAANDRLIGVVSIQMQAAATEDFREDVARRGDTLTGGASDADGKGLLHTQPPNETL